MDNLAKLHSVVTDTLHDVFSLRDGLHKASLFVLSEDELTEFVRYKHNRSITVVRSDNTDITTASPWLVLSDASKVRTPLRAQVSHSLKDPYLLSNNITSFICAPVGTWKNVSLFLWADSNTESVLLSDVDEQNISRWSERFHETVEHFCASGSETVSELLNQLVDNQDGVSTLPVPTNDGDRDVTTLSDSAIRIEGLEAVETHLRIYERAVKATNSGVTIVDARLPDYPIIYANPAFEKMTGFSFAETVGRNARFLQRGEIDQGVLSTIRVALGKGTHCKVTLRNFKKDGTLFWNELTLSPIIDSDGFLTHYIGIQNDISARVEAERQLIEAKERELKVPKLLAHAASLARVIGWQFDLDSGQMIVVGDIVSLLGKKEEDIPTPARLFDTVLPAYAESAIDSLDAAMADEVELSLVLPVSAENGQEKWVHFTAKLFPDGVARDGGHCLAGTLQDVTSFR